MTLIRKQFLGLSLLLVLVPASLAFQTWERPVQPVSPEKFMTLVPHPLSPADWIVASSSQIFEGDQKKQWRVLWQTYGATQKINRLVVCDKIPNAVFVLTSDGVFQTNLDAQKKWLRAGQNKMLGGKNILGLGISPDRPEHWFLGTTSGLFESQNGGKQWARSEQFKGNVPFPIVYASGRFVFAGTGQQLFRSEDTGNFRLIFSFLAETSEGINPDEEWASFENEAEPYKPAAGFNELIASRANPQMLWLGTSRGVFESRTQGANWNLLPTSGLRNTLIKHLAYDDKTGQLYAGTFKGVYVYRPSQNKWEEIFQGLTDTDVRDLLITGEEENFIVALTGDGIMRMPIIPEEILPPDVRMPDLEQMNLFQRLIRLEPSARDIQLAVIRYANVGNGKIKRWHVESRLKSILPSVSAGRDFSQNNNIDIDRGSTTDPDRFIFGPDDTDQNANIDVSWDLGDFIWSSDQTSIDSREKMMVELRSDLLADATRTYYERRRLQMDIVFSPVDTESELLEKLIRMDELTALLDAMTDGLMSQRLEILYGRYPELQLLWAKPKNSPAE